MTRVFNFDQTAIFSSKVDALDPLIFGIGVAIIPVIVDGRFDLDPSLRLLRKILEGWESAGGERSFGRRIRVGVGGLGLGYCNLVLHDDWTVSAFVTSQ